VVQDIPFATIRRFACRSLYQMHTRSHKRARTRTRAHGHPQAPTQARAHSPTRSVRRGSAIFGKTGKFGAYGAPDDVKVSHDHICRMHTESDVYSEHVSSVNGTRRVEFEHSTPPAPRAPPALVYVFHSFNPPSCPPPIRCEPGGKRGVRGEARSVLA
jgi:hypothetical protein